jgi:hypothetical protein
MDPARHRHQLVYSGCGSLEVSRTFCYAKLRSLPQANVRYFFVRFDLMNWKDYGIMVR